MQEEAQDRVTDTNAWDDAHVKALLHFPRFPIRLIQQEPWQSWIGARGGLKAVIAYLRAYPLSPSHQRMLDVVLAHPEAVAEVYADRLNISRATYFYQLRGFIAALVQALNHWEIDTLPARSTTQPDRLNLPATLTDLVGAEKTMARLQRLFERPEVRLLTLLGPGGIGKTRLSIELAHHLDRPVCFVDLAGLSDPNQVAGTIAQTLGLRDASSCGLQNWLQTRSFLLILDNFEQILAAKGLVTSLLKAAPRLKIIVTSRIALHVYGEHEFVVPPLATSSGISAEIQPTCPPPAVRLFEQRAQAVNPNFKLTPQNISAVVRLCQHAEGLPLAIELAAFQVKYYSPQALVKRMGTQPGLDFFCQAPERTPPHQKTLRAMFDWSYDLLTPRLQLLFCHLSVLPEGFSTEKAESVCGLTDIHRDLIALVDHSLLEQQTDSNGEPRFQMLGLAREYAIERFSTAHELSL